MVRVEPELPASTLSKESRMHVAFCATGEVFHTLRADGHDASEGGTGRGSGAVAICFTAQDHGADATNDLSPTLRAPGASGANGGVMPAVAFAPDLARTLTARHDSSPCADRGMDVVAQSALQVRRLTPTECERLQGFPDGWTAIPYRGKPASDGPRYKALGNSMAVPVMAWIGRQIEIAESGLT